MLRLPKSRLLSGRRRTEDGATAVLVAILAMVLFGAGALAVDLGNALARKGNTQAQADLAALAGAADLPGTKVAGDEVVQAVAQYFVDNATQHDDGAAPRTLAQVTADLVNGVNTDGEVYFPSEYEVGVVSPQAHVNFGGLAGVFNMFGENGWTGVDVQSEATALLGSPDGTGVLPMYVASPTPGNPGCDYGLQTLTDPPGGHVVPPSVPTLAYDGDNNNNDLDDDISVLDNGVEVSSIPQNSTTGAITLFGDFRDAMRVGFFRTDDTSNAAVVEVARNAWTSPAGTGPYTQNNGQISVQVPPSVTAVDQLWYVRVYQAGTSNKWSEKDEAQPLSIGDAPFECVGGSVDGNFGTLKMPRSTSPSTWIPRNIALGLEAPLSLTIFPGSPPPWICSAAMPEAVISTSANRRPGTNCLDTDTGMTHTTATPGFINGGSGFSGLLQAGSSSDDPDGSGGCAPNGTTSTTTINSRTLNNDILTCFLTDTTTTLGTVARRNYTGGVKFHPEIYESPRFAWVPVFKQETESGGSGYYTIIDFRPAFITDQPMSATKANNTVGSSTTNGLGMSGARLETIKVIFLHVNSLPDGQASTPIGPYLGTGPQIIRLID